MSVRIYEEYLNVSLLPLTTKRQGRAFLKHFGISMEVGVPNPTGSDPCSKQYPGRCRGALPGPEAGGLGWAGGEQLRPCLR